MSSDPFTDLAGSTEAFAMEFRELMACNPRPTPGSPADAEMEGEPFAGDWASHPSRDAFAAACLLATSCTDHLLGLVGVLRSRNAVLCAYTLTRGAAEAAALGCYLTDPGIDGRERVRRAMNYRLDGLCEMARLLKDMPGPHAAKRLDETRQRIADFARGASQHGFDFHKASDRGHPAHVGEKQPAAMILIGLAVDKDMPDVGRTYQRLLSATAHSAVHGLARMLTPLPASEDHPDEALAAVNRNPRSLARELLAGPLAAHSLARGVESFTGCDMSDLHRPANHMLLVWSRVGEMDTLAAST